MTIPAAGARSSAQDFAGFPAGGRATAVPSLFFSQLMPLIEDAAELRVTLYVIYALSRRKGYPRFVTERELRAEAPLMASLSDGSDVVAHEALRRGLDLATERLSLLRVDVEHGGKPEQLYLLNTPSDRRAAALIRDGRTGAGQAAAAGAGRAGVRSARTCFSSTKRTSGR